MKYFMNFFSIFLVIFNLIIFNTSAIASTQEVAEKKEMFITQLKNWLAPSFDSYDQEDQEDIDEDLKSIFKSLRKKQLSHAIDLIQVLEKTPLNVEASPRKVKYSIREWKNIIKRSVSLFNNNNDDYKSTFLDNLEIQMHKIKSSDLSGEQYVNALSKAIDDARLCEQN